MCQAITLKGSECKRSNVNDEEYCRQHLEIEKSYNDRKLFFSCQFKYKNGNICNKRYHEERDYCELHQFKEDQKYIKLDNSFLKYKKTDTALYESCLRNQYVPRSNFCTHVTINGKKCIHLKSNETSKLCKNHHTQKNKPKKPVENIDANIDAIIETYNNAIEDAIDEIKNEEDIDVKTDNITPVIEEIIPLEDVNNDTQKIETCYICTYPFTSNNPKINFKECDHECCLNCYEKIEKCHLCRKSFPIRLTKGIIQRVEKINLQFSAITEFENVLSKYRVSKLKIDKGDFNYIQILRRRINDLFHNIQYELYDHVNYSNGISYLEKLISPFNYDEYYSLIKVLNDLETFIEEDYQICKYQIKLNKIYYKHKYSDIIDFFSKINNPF